MYLEAERRRLYENKNNKLFRILNINSPYYDYFFEHSIFHSKEWTQQS